MFKLGEKQKSHLLSELIFQFSRSSGPGGQKVNKTESQAELRWNVLVSQVFTESQIIRLQDKLKNLINKEGELVLSSDQFRSRERNKQACIDHLYEHIEKALHRPKKRKPTKPSRGAIQKRLDEKKKHSEKKKNRQKWD